MAAKKQLKIYLAISMLALMIVLTGLPQTIADDVKVKITFNATGFGSTYNGLLFTIDGSTYSNAHSFQWVPGSTHTVTAISSFTGSDSNVYSFTSWTNGDGLTTNTGTYTVPGTNTDVTANYAKATTYTARFTTTGLSNINANVLQIDGTSYTLSALSSTSFSWAAGSTHSVVSLQPVYSYDTPPKGYNLASWTNGNGLVTASGTFTMPASAVTVTANYVQATVQVTFATNGLSNLNAGQNVLTVDGTSYDYWGIQNLKLQWLKGSTHTVTAVSSVTGWDNVKHDFSSWTNGDGLTSNSGTYTTPTSDVQVTANYVVSSTTSHIARFATSGLSNINGDTIEIDGVKYPWSDISSLAFNWATGSTHTITALQPVYSYDTPPKGYNFVSWTNGNGLVTASGTFTMPNSDVTVTATYAQATVQVTFGTTNLSKLNADTILTIDGTAFTISDIPNIKFQWMKGSTHSITAVSSVTGWDNVKHDFSSWTNGDGLTSNSGTYTTPNSDTQIIANYVTSTTTNYVAKFAISGASNLNGNILQIDGVNYLFSDLPSKTFLWAAGSTHTVVALQPVYSYDTPPKGYNFVSWTNGNGLVTTSGTFTMPASDVTVTANYVQVTVQVTFIQSGLSNLNAGQTVVTIDGVAYDYWDMQNFKAQWMPGSTHSVTAAASITGWDNVPHYFRSWTNGNGLTSISGTFTTPGADVVVGVNYGLTSTITTVLSIDCSSTSVNPGSAVTILGTLTGEGTGVGGKTISLSYYDGASWVTIGSTTTAASGYYSYSWTLPSSIANGEYPLKATFGGDTLYLASSGSTGTPGNGGNVHVLPESWGSLVALVACFGGAFVFIGVRARKSKKLTL